MQSYEQDGDPKYTDIGPWPYAPLSGPEDY